MTRQILAALLCAFLGTQNLRKDEDGVDEDGNGCTLMAEVCESPADISKEEFTECCKGAQWFCKDGNCHHARGACSAAAEELFKDEEMDCDGAADLLQYHQDHARQDEKKAEALLERKQASTKTDKRAMEEMT